jgi:hypothetical protein
MRMLSQPFLRLQVIGACGSDMFPEAIRVVHLPEVHQFVNDNVVANEFGRLDETPVQANGFIP